jgi:hypothetical protein
MGAFRGGLKVDMRTLATWSACFAGTLERVPNGSLMSGWVSGFISLLIQFIVEAIETEFEVVFCGVESTFQFLLMFVIARRFQFLLDTRDVSFGRLNGVSAGFNCHSEPSLVKVVQFVVALSCVLGWTAVHIFRSSPRFNIQDLEVIFGVLISVWAVHDGRHPRPVRKVDFGAVTAELLLVLLIQLALHLEILLEFLPGFLRAGCLDLLGAAFGQFRTRLGGTGVITEDEDVVLDKLHPIAFLYW